MGLGVKRGTVKMESSSESWKQDYEKERAILLKIFDNKCLEIEHIGSTAVPNLIAKPIIDIAIKVLNIEIVNQIHDRLVKIGYEERIGRLKGRQKVYAKGRDSKVTHHLHIIEEGEIDWEEKIQFRDKLIDNAEIANEYAELKKILAKKNKNNRTEYTNKKSKFIKKVLNIMEKKRKFT